MDCVLVEVVGERAPVIPPCVCVVCRMESAIYLACARGFATQKAVTIAARRTKIVNCTNRPTPLTGAAIRAKKLMAANCEKQRNELSRRQRTSIIFSIVGESFRLQDKRTA